MEAKKKNSAMTFEDAMDELETIALKLESGTLGLDESIKEFERGMALAKFCHEKLEAAARKIEILQKGEDGKVKSKKVAVKQETGELEEGEELQGTLL